MSPSLPRVLRELTDRAYWAVGRDYVSGLPIRRRTDLEDLGGADGGWIVPGSLLAERSICYCVGCGEDISFDLALIERFACKVWAFDPTPRAIEYVERHAGENASYNFTPVGVWDKADHLRFFAPSNPAHVSHSLVNLQGTTDFIEVEVDCLENLMRERGHDRLDLLKLDIEGAEYRVLEHVAGDDIDVRILLVEYDETLNPLDENWLSRIRESTRLLSRKGFELVAARGRGNYTFVRG